MTFFFKGDPSAAPATVVSTPIARVGAFELSPGDKWTSAVPTGQSLSTTFTFNNREKTPVRITKVVPEGHDFTAILRTLQDGQRYAVSVTTAPALRPGKHEAKIDVITDDPRMASIPLSLDLTVYPLTIASPQRIMLPQLLLTNDLSKVVVPFIRVARNHGEPLVIKGVSTDLPFLKLSIQPENPGRSYLIHSEIDGSSQKKAGKFDGKVRIETNDPDAPVIEVEVHGSFIQAG